MRRRTYFGKTKELPLEDGKPIMAKIQIGNSINDLIITVKSHFVKRVDQRTIFFVDTVKSRYVLLYDPKLNELIKSKQ